MVWVRVNSPYWFLDDVEASIVSTPLKSSLAFTFLGFLIWNNEKYKCKYKFYKDLEYLGIFWHFVFSKSLYYCLLLEFSVLCLILISLFPYFLIFINIYGSPRYSKMRFTCSGERFHDAFVSPLIITELVMAKEKADKIQINGEGHYKLAKK